MTVLYINRFDSRCGECGRGASPDEKNHDTYLGYGDNKEGCHAEFTQLASDYPGMKERCQEMRPDLEWAGYDG